MSLKDKIKTRLDTLQEMMEDQQHIKNPWAVAEQIESVRKFWSVLSEEDRDFIHGCTAGLEWQMEWKINDADI